MSDLAGVAVFISPFAFWGLDAPCTGNINPCHELLIFVL